MSVLKFRRHCICAGIFLRIYIYLFFNNKKKENSKMAIININLTSLSFESIISYFLTKKKTYMHCTLYKLAIEIRKRRAAELES